MTRPTQDEHPDGDAITAMALEAELAFDRPAPRFGEITTDTKLDSVIARNDRSKPATDAEESTPASASSRPRLAPVHPDAMLIPRISRSSSPPREKK